MAGSDKHVPAVAAQVSAIPEAAEPTGATKDVQDLINPFKAKVGKGLAEWEAKQYIRKSNKIFVKVCIVRVGLAVDETTISSSGVRGRRLLRSPVYTPRCYGEE